MRKSLLLLPAVPLIAFGLFMATTDKDMRQSILHFPTDTDVLFWSLEQRDAAFRVLDRWPILAEARTIETGPETSPFPEGKPLTLSIDLDAYMDEQRTSGLVIVHNGKVRLEEYGLGFGPEGKWTSFSVAKSLTSTLVGAAIKDGYIKSIDDRVSHYIPDLKGSAYDDVTIEQLLTMTSGVQWNEDYADHNSDVARFNNHKAEPDMDVTVSYMRQLTSESEPGSQWVYKTGETNLIGVLVSSATNKTLSEYLSEKIWKPFGMEQDATWLLGSTGHEISGCCVQASVRDYARIGLFMLADGKIDGESVVPDNWVEQATTKSVDIGVTGEGYGYQWWTYDDGSYAARGIFGQGLFIDPSRNLVIASTSNWPQATDQHQDKQRMAFYHQVQQDIDKEIRL